jgi:hypothetical protein
MGVMSLCMNGITPITYYSYLPTHPLPPATTVSMSAGLR